MVCRYISVCADGREHWEGKCIVRLMVFYSPVREKGD